MLEQSVFFRAARSFLRDAVRFTNCATNPGFRVSNCYGCVNQRFVPRCRRYFRDASVHVGIGQLAVYGRIPPSRFGYTGNAAPIRHNFVSRATPGEHPLVSELFRRIDHGRSGKLSTKRPASTSTSTAPNA